MGLADFAHEIRITSPNSSGIDWK